MNLSFRDGIKTLLRPAWWRGFLPARTRINNRERFRIVAGSLFGIFLTGLLCFYFGPSSVVQKLPWLVAPLGASAVLVENGEDLDLETRAKLAKGIYDD